MRRKRNGFTVVELIYMLVAVAVLTAVVVPAAIGARSESASTMCLSNMRQLGMALMMYTQDTGGSLPTVIKNDDPFHKDTAGVEIFCGHAKLWDEWISNYARKFSMKAVLSSYVCNPSTWKCPSDGACDTGCVSGSRWSSYHYRYYIALAMARVGTDRPMKVSDFQSPGSVYVFNEIQPFHDPRTAQLAWLGKAGWDPSDRMNFTFLDGHAAAAQVGTMLCKDSDKNGFGWDPHWCRDQKTGAVAEWSADSVDVASVQ